MEIAIGAVVVVLALVLWALTGEDAGERARREVEEGWGEVPDDEAPR